MKPPFRYYGSKVRLAPLIVEAMPRHRVYVEPFAGSLSVLFAKERSHHEVVNDLSDDVVHFLRVLRDHTSALERACRLTPHSRREFETAAAQPHHPDPVERARRFWVRVNQGFNGSPVRVGWATSVNQNTNRAVSAANIANRLADCAHRLRLVTIECRPAVEVLDRYAIDGSVVYLDPPYPESSRSSRRKRSADYLVEMTDDDHRDLAAVARAKRGATVIVSGYDCPLYDELYGDWPRWEVGVDRPSTRGSKSGVTSGVEVLWANRPIFGKGV